MDKKEYTTSNCFIVDDLKYNINDKINWPHDYDPYFGKNFYSWCQYLLPCGLCEKTMQQCPKHQPNQIFITYDYNTGGSLNG